MHSESVEEDGFLHLLQAVNVDERSNEERVVHLSEFADALEVLEYGNRRDFLCVEDGLFMESFGEGGVRRLGGE